MRRNPSAAFTLLEMMTVIAVIVILTGLVLNLAGFAQRKGALARATGEIQMLMSACESYKSDNGNYPRDRQANSTSSATDNLSPKQNFSPNGKDFQLYASASLFLYKQLSGDLDANGVPDQGVPRYFKDLDLRILNATKNANNVISQVNYLQDPFGFSYGYSTAAAAAEESFQSDVLQGKRSPTRRTGNALPGFNINSFDLWSTSGSTGTKTPDLEWAQWAKNW